jgi:hypothetical protein
MDRDEITGGCYCGAARYRARGTPLHRCLCHCESCRRVVGAQSVAWVTFPLEGFAWTQGEPARFRSSPPVERTFCGTCGASLTYAYEGRPGEIDLTTATLDDPEAFPPTKAVFEEMKLSWVEESARSPTEGDTTVKSWLLGE